jgi:hypothetical protein
MTLEDGQPSQGHADDARSLRSPDAAAEAAGPAAGAPVHGTPGAPLQPSARVVEVDAGGMPLFRTDPGFSGPPIDLATALQLEQDALMQEDFFLDGPGVRDDFLAERADQEQAEREAF